MENSAQALLMAAAVLIFVIAIALSFTTIAKAKYTADMVLYYSDRATFKGRIDPDAEEASDGGRTVGVDTVIATLARCTKENFAVKIIDGSNEQIFDYSIQNAEDLKEAFYNFVRRNINKENKYYRETYSEVTISGKTYEEEGIILEEDVGKRIYVTYKKI